MLISICIYIYHKEKYMNSPYLAVSDNRFLISCLAVNKKVIVGFHNFFKAICSIWACSLQWISCYLYVLMMLILDNCQVQYSIILSSIKRIHRISTFLNYTAVLYLHNISLLPNWDYQNVTTHNWTCHHFSYGKYNWVQKYNWLCRDKITTSDIWAEALWNSGGKMTAEKQKIHTKYSHNFLTPKHDPIVWKKQLIFQLIVNSQYFRWTIHYD